MMSSQKSNVTGGCSSQQVKCQLRCLHPHMNACVGFAGIAADPSFLLGQTMGGSCDGTSSFGVPTKHVGHLGCVLAPGIGTFKSWLSQGFEEQINRWKLALSLCLHLSTSHVSK